MTNSLEQLLNLCLRARGLVSGDVAVRKAIQSKKAYLILVAKDASPRTVEQFIKIAQPYLIPLAICGSKNDFGRILKKPPRSVVAITDQHFTQGVLRVLERGEGQIMIV